MFAEGRRGAEQCQCVLGVCLLLTCGNVQPSCARCDALDGDMGMRGELTLALFLAVALVVGCGAGLVPYARLILLSLLVLIATKHRRRIYIILATLPRDLRFIYRFGKVAIKTRMFLRNNTTMLTLFAKRTAKEPDKPCFIFEDKTWTNADVDRYSNQIAQVFLAAGYSKGDVIALYMGNRPEYICIWLGLAKIGVVSALVNTNLKSQPLVHSLSVAKVKCVIFSQELAGAITELTLENVERYQFGGAVPEGAKIKSLDTLLESASTSHPNVPPPGYRDKLMYIYTSGTTGLPKAAIILHSRYLLVAMAGKHILALRSDDIIYNPLPLYHTAGGVLGTGPTLVEGIPCVIRTKFSASAYWSECIKYNCTIAQYIGEICRYLLAVPPKPEDSTHRVRLMVGNGMKPTIWKQFVERFKVEQVCELYGATEGNTNIVNLDNTIGAVGFLPRFLPLSVFPMALLRMNHETGEPIRNKKGFCIRCDFGEPGMCVGIINTTDAIREFHGYLDQEASKKKIIENVFKPGDKAFLSGDILVMDEFGYLYFKDRTGDTFRWKGENVATAEVEAIISSLISLQDAIAVYGVEVPGTEGRAGMAAIVDPDNVLDLKALAEGLNKALPVYARPVFLRVMEKIQLTGTYKIKKNELQTEGFDPSLVKDKLYISKGKDYIPLTQDIYNDILTGAVRL